MCGKFYGYEILMRKTLQKRRLMTWSGSHRLQRVRQNTWLVLAEPTDYNLVQRLSPPLQKAVPPRGRSMLTHTITGAEALARILLNASLYVSLHV